MYRHHLGIAHGDCRAVALIFEENDFIDQDSRAYLLDTQGACPGENGDCGLSGVPSGAFAI